VSTPAHLNPASDPTAAHELHLINNRVLGVGGEGSMFSSVRHNTLNKAIMFCLLQRLLQELRLRSPSNYFKGMYRVSA
jgi:hypothetical protein